MLADLCVATEDAVFGDPAIRMGMASANPLWLWHVGPRRAREIYFGRLIDARTALRWGLISRVVPPDELAEAANQALAGLISHSAGMTGSDGHAAHQYLQRPATAAAGLWTAFDFAQSLAGLSAIQRGGFREGEYDFWSQVQANGIEDALAERDRRYERQIVAADRG
jgi:enoyl-CoA hydratase/carnithine racemase